MRALIIEPTPEGQQVLAAVLSQLHWEVLLAADADEALDILKGPDPPRAILLSAELTGGASLDLCRRLRRGPDGNHFHILLLSDKPDVAAATAALEAGADDYLPLTVTLAELKARLLPAQHVQSAWDELQNARRLAQQQASHDLLTGLDNRLTVLDALRNEFIRARRQHSSLGAILLSVDHFAALADAYARRGAEAALCEVARRIADTVRPYDATGRFAEDEFLIVTPGVNAEQAASLANRLRQAVISQPVRAMGRSIAVTVSMGVAAVAPEDETDETLLLRQIETAVHNARAAGGDRIVLADPHRPPADAEPAAVAAAGAAKPAGK